jgi:SAM-dependent methyltransferase
LTRSRFRSRSLGARVALLARLRPQGGRLLDVGCGSGDFLAAAYASGQWRAEGLEPNAEAARLASKAPGIVACVGDLSSPGDLSGPYDVITMWHALEHVPDPEAALRSALRFLADDGLLIVALPMVDSAEARLFRAAWAGYDLPRHLHAHSRSTMRLLTERLGLAAREERGVIAGFNSCKISLVLWMKQRRAPRFLLPAAPISAAVIYLALLPFSMRRPSVGVFVLRRRTEPVRRVASEAR